MKYSAAHSADSNLRLLIKGNIDPFAKNKSGARMAARAVAAQPFTIFVSERV
jgi:hypothetical protein